ncbi:hypothetical protein ADL26_13350, partial [Thermoactinomyces vulgaris]
SDDEVAVVEVDGGVGEDEAVAAGERESVEAVRARVVEHQEAHAVEVDAAAGAGRRGRVEDRAVAEDDLDRDAVRRGQDDEVVNPGEQLRCGAAQFEVGGERVAQRPSHRDAGGEVDRCGRNGHFALIEADGELDARLGGDG